MNAIIFDSLCNSKSIRKERYRLVQSIKRQAHSSYDRTLRCSGSIDREGFFNGSCEFRASIHKKRGSDEWSLADYNDHSIQCGDSKLIVKSTVGAMLLRF
jgi:hypothetical protein